MSEEAAYKTAYPLGLAEWPASPEFPNSAVIPYYKQILSHCGYFAICGAKGCIRACMSHLENKKSIGQSDFLTPVFPDKPWQLDSPDQDETGGIAEGKYVNLYNAPDPQAGSWI